MVIYITNCYMLQFDQLNLLLGYGEIAYFMRDYSDPKFPKNCAHRLQIKNHKLQIM